MPIFAILSQNGVNILGLQIVRQCALVKLLKLIYKSSQEKEEKKDRDVAQLVGT